MNLKYEYEAIGDVPKGFEELYTERDGKAVLTGVEGLKTPKDVDTLQEALRKERTDHKGLKEKFKVWGDLDPDEVLTKLDEYPTLKELADNQGDVEGKVNSLLEKKIAQVKAPLERELGLLKTQSAELQAERDLLATSISRKELTDQIKTAAINAGVAPTAVDDVVIIASNHFELQDGKAVIKENAPLTQGLGTQDYFAEMQNHKPHWWPASKGGGANGSGGSPGGGDNPFSKDGWNMTRQGQLYKENPQRAERLAEAAGTKIGGTRPAT